jgi:hypothetical protein
MYLKKLSVAYKDLVKALRAVKLGGRKLQEPDFRIDFEYRNEELYPGISCLAVFLPPDRIVRTQFFLELAYAIGNDDAARIAYRSRTVETEADMVIYFPSVTLTGVPVAA